MAIELSTLATNSVSAANEAAVMLAGRLAKLKVKLAWTEYVVTFSMRVVVVVIVVFDPFETAVMALVVVVLEIPKYFVQ